MSVNQKRCLPYNIQQQESHLLCNAQREHSIAKVPVSLCIFYYANKRPWRHCAFWLASHQSSIC